MLDHAEIIEHNHIDLSPENTRHIADRANGHECAILYGGRHRVAVDTHNGRPGAHLRQVDKPDDAI